MIIDCMGMAVVTRMVSNVKKRIKLLFISCLSVIWMLSMAMVVSAAEVKKDGWYYEVVEESGREGYRYYIGGKLKVLSWMYNTDTGIWYYLDAEGIMTTGWGEGYAEGHYFDKNGVMVTGWNYLMASASEIPNGKVQSTTNVVEASSPSEALEYSGWYFFKADGSMATGWEKIDGAWYYFADEKIQGFCKGQMLTGKVSLEGNEYYFCDVSGEMRTGFVSTDEATYYYSSVGMMKKNAWITEGKNKYYAGEDGKLYMGTETEYAVKTISGALYAFDEKGIMQKSRTLYCVNEKWIDYKPRQAGEYQVCTFSKTGKGTLSVYKVG